jgi:hypothetical protein
VHHPILVCTYTNVAVDNLVEGLVKAGLQPLRIGPDGRVKESLLPFSLKGRLKGHALHADFLDHRQRANEQRKNLRTIRSGRALEALQKHAEDWKKYCECILRFGRVYLEIYSPAAQLVIWQDARMRVGRLEKQMIYHIMHTSDVVGLTVTAAAQFDNTLPGVHDLHNIR